MEFSISNFLRFPKAYTGVLKRVKKIKQLSVSDPMPINHHPKLRVRGIIALFVRVVIISPA